MKPPMLWVGEAPSYGNHYVEFKLRNYPSTALIEIKLDLRQEIFSATEHDPYLLSCDRVARAVSGADDITPHRRQLNEDEIFEAEAEA